MTTIYKNANQTYSNVNYAFNGVTGSSGQVITTSGSNGISWAQPNANFNDGNSAVMTIPHGSKTVEIREEATLDVKGTVKINGVNLEERLNTIETVLQIPTRDVIMESKYPKLAELYKQYMRELGKLKTWDALKESK